MKNQVDQLNAFGVNARFLNSTLSKSEINKLKKATLEGEVKLLYVAPESLTKEENVEFLKNAKTLLPRLTRHTVYQSGVMILDLSIEELSPL